MIIGSTIFLIVLFAAIVFSLPGDGWRMVYRNCFRQDGSFSVRRRNREIATLGQYSMTILVPACFLFLASIVALSFVFTYVIPSDLIARSFERMELNSESWKQNLGDVRKDHTEFLVRAGVDKQTITEIQRNLWHHWLAFAGTVLLLMVVITSWALRFCRQGIRQLGVGVRQRRSQYAWRDTNRMLQAAQDQIPLQTMMSHD